MKSCKTFSRSKSICLACFPQTPRLIRLERPPSYLTTEEVGEEDVLTFPLEFGYFLDVC